MDNSAPSTIILISGDRDFAYALSVLRLRRYRVILVTLPNAHATLTAQASVCFDWVSEILDPTGANGARNAQNRFPHERPRSFDQRPPFAGYSPAGFRQTRPMEEDNSLETDPEDAADITQYLRNRIQHRQNQSQSPHGPFLDRPCPERHGQDFDSQPLNSVPVKSAQPPPPDSSPMCNVSNTPTQRTFVPPPIISGSQSSKTISRPVQTEDQPSFIPAAPLGPVSPPAADKTISVSRAVQTEDQPTQIPAAQREPVPVPVADKATLGSPPSYEGYAPEYPAKGVSIEVQADSPSPRSNTPPRPDIIDPTYRPSSAPSSLQSQPLPLPDLHDYELPAAAPPGSFGQATDGKVQTTANSPQKPALSDSSTSAIPSEVPSAPPGPKSANSNAGATANSMLPVPLPVLPVSPKPSMSEHAEPMNTKMTPVPLLPISDPSPSTTSTCIHAPQPTVPPIVDKRDGGVLSSSQPVPFPGPSIVFGSVKDTALLLPPRDIGTNSAPSASWPPTPPVIPSPPKVIPTTFVILVQTLQAHRAKGVARPLRTTVALEIAKGGATYKNAGVDKFSQYTALAEKQGIIELGVLQTTAWMSLKPVWYDAVP